MQTLKTIETDLQNILDDYFYTKTKDFVFNEFEEDLKTKEMQDIIEDCIEDIRQSFNYFDKKLDDFLEDYELHRMEDLKEYEYKIEHC